MSNNGVVIITGASSGIGEATARLLGRDGYRVVLAARRVDRLRSLAEEIQAQGGQALPVAVDVGRLADIENLVDSALDRFGQIDVLFNNAGFGCLDWLENLDPVKDIESQLRVNLLGLVQTTRAVLPHMIGRSSGHIINMASMASFVAAPTYSIYAASKFAVRGFSEALRREACVWNIHVSAIYPGGVETEFREQAGVKRKTGATTPAALRLEPEDIARAVAKVIRNPRRTVILPWPMIFAVWANRFFPGLVDQLIERSFTRPERGL